MMAELIAPMTRQLMDIKNMHESAKQFSDTVVDKVEGLKKALTQTD